VTLDETYERILQQIPKANRVHTHRLLQCLAVAVRPLRVQELAEVLAIDFSVTNGIPKLDENLRWQDQEQAVLSACSSLIDVADFRNSRMVQFSHYSVKEFLTSDRLATSVVDPLRDHHILLEHAHTTIAKACIGVLLRLEQPINNETIKKFPLADYSAKHFADHAEFGNVISLITSAIDNLLDTDKPHFAIWISHISSSWWAEKHSGSTKGSPLYHVADLGFYALVQYITMKRPQDVIARGGVRGTPVHAALYRRHVQICQYLLPRCVGKDVRDTSGQTPLHVAASNALLEVTRMTIELGADIDARDNNGWTPLHQAVDTSQLLEKRKIEIVQLLLDHGANIAARTNNDHVTVLHLAAKNGDLAATRLLLAHGVSIDARDESSHTSLHFASWSGNPDVVQLLLDRGADLEAQSDDHNTPLHIAAENGKVAAVRSLSIMARIFKHVAIIFVHHYTLHLVMKIPMLCGSY
jgi:ankyrin repeat protein